VDVNAGDGAELRRSNRRRGRRGRGQETGSGAAALSMTWPGGCPLDWQERERISHAALERCSQTTAGAAPGIERRR